jgi:hypothetical protein
VDGFPACRLRHALATPSWRWKAMVSVTSFRKPLPDRKLPAGGRPKGTQLLEPIAPSKARTRLWLNSVRRTRSPTPCVANHEEDRGLSLAYEVRSAGVSSLREPRARLCSWKPELASPLDSSARFRARATQPSGLESSSLRLHGSLSE